MKSRGLISSRREPTAEKAIIASTPMDFKAAMLALAGTSDGFIKWPAPWRARKATWWPASVSQIIILELGLPHGFYKWYKYKNEKMLKKKYVYKCIYWINYKWIRKI